MAKKPVATETATTFTAQVTMTGDAAAGTLEISMVQVQLPDRPERPPTEPPSPPTSPPVSPPISPPVSPPVSPPGGGSGGGGFEPPAYLRTDADRVPTPNVPRPGYLQPWKDPNFGSTITRITGDPGSSIDRISGGRWGEVCRHHYNSDSAWSYSPTEGLIYLDTNDGGSPSSLILDGNTYEPICAPQNKPSSADVRWYPGHDGLMICAAKDKLLSWDPRTGRQETIESFSGFSDLTFGPWEGSPSQDGKVVVLTSDSQGKAFAFDIANGMQYDTISGSTWGTFSDARISASGKYILWKLSPDEVVITDLDGNEISHLANNMISHFDVIVGEDGEDYVCGRVNSSSVNQGPSGLVSAYRLRDGKRTGLMTGKAWCSHTSARAQATHRWICSAGTPEGGDYVHNDELVLCDLTNGPPEYRIAHVHSNSNVDYVGEIQPCISPTGGRIIFASPWGSANRPVGAYVADFRK